MNPKEGEESKNLRDTLKQLYSTLSGYPLPLSAVFYGWEADDTTRCRSPPNMEDGVPYALGYVLKLVRCGCAPARPCRGGNCGSMGRQLLNTLFCACGNGSACANLFHSKEHSTEDVNDTGDADDQGLEKSNEEN